MSNICTHPSCKLRGTEHATCLVGIEQRLTERELIALMAAALYPEKSSPRLDEKAESLAVNRAIRILGEIDARMTQGLFTGDIGRFEGWSDANSLHMSSP